MAAGNKKVSCGIIITDGTRYLMCHPTGSHWWNIPKGIMDPGESFDEAAIRELKEETGLSASKKDIDFIGHFPYKRDKDLALFLMKVETMPDVRKLFCDSTFKQGHKDIPEMDGFQIVSKSIFLEKINPALRKVVENLI
jgi:8-oxo-dGTP pyrophosphatase MutT (NUDIX family)